MSDNTDKMGAAPGAAPAQPDNIGRAKFFLSEGIIIAAASACAYLLAFNYEKGYAQHFSIPIQFVNVSLANLLIFVAVVVAFLTLSIVYLNLFFGMLGHPRLRYFFMLFVFVGAAVYLYGLSDWRHWLPYVVGLLIVLVMTGLLDYGLPLLAHRKAGDFKARYEAQAAIDQADPSFVVRLHRWLGFDVYFLFTSLLISCLLASTAGDAEALQQKEFYVTDTTPEMVVLRVYGDTMIAAPFDRATKEVRKSSRLLKISEGGGPTLTLEEIGPLKPVPAPTPSPAAAKTEPASSPSPVPLMTPGPVESPQGSPVQQQPDPTQQPRQ